MSKRDKKKKITAGIVSSVTLVGAAAAGILYTSELEANTEEEKKQNQLVCLLNNHLPMIK